MPQATSKSEKKHFWHRSRKYLREYNEVTGIHGLRYITEKRSTAEKIIWIIIILISLAGCLYMIYEIVDKYRNSPVVVSFSTKYKPIYEIPFPAVTICPETKCSRKHFNYTDVFLRFMEDNSTIDEGELQKFHYISLVCKQEREIIEDRLLLNGNRTVGKDFYEILDKICFKISISCDFMDKNTYSSSECENTFIPIITDEGICYSFNILDRNRLYRDHVFQYSNYHRVEADTGDFDEEYGYGEKAGVETYPKRALMSGINNALDIFFFHPLNETDYACSKFMQGFRVAIHNPMDIPGLSKHYFTVPFDKIVIAAVQPEIITTSDAVKEFSPEKRECYLNSERHLEHFKMYTQSNCLLECVTNYTLNKCGCVDFYMPRGEDTEVCGTASIQCVEEATKELNVKELEKKISGKNKENENHCDCKPLCTDLRYNTENSHSDFKWKEFSALNEELYSNIFNNEPSHVSRLLIYLKSEQFMSLERHELYGISDLISNFGGLLGLFTGFSLISLVELIYFLTLRIFCNVRLYNVWSGPSNN